MNKSYASYIEARIIRRAMTSRGSRAHLFCMPMEIEAAIKNCSGKEYITPAGMSIVLDCSADDLCKSLEQHKRSLPMHTMLDKYGNRNWKVNYEDKVYLQGWINYLGLDCFSDSEEAALVVSELKKRVAA